MDREILNLFERDELTQEMICRIVKEQPEIALLYLRDKLTEEMEETLEKEHSFLYDLRLWDIEVKDKIKELEYYKEIIPYCYNSLNINYINNYEIFIYKYSITNYGITIYSSPISCATEKKKPKVFEVLASNIKTAQEEKFFSQFHLNDYLNNSLTIEGMHYYINKIANL